MTGTSSSSEHLSVVIATETVYDVTQTTASNVATTSSSRGIEFYFQCAVVVIGVVGTAANALILYALVASKQHKKHVLIFHQNVLDFFSSLLLVITYALKLCNIHLTGLGGYWLCMLLLSENILWCGIVASKTNLMALTIDRYLKVVYPTWSKKHLRGWILHSATVFSCSGAVVHVFALTFSTSAVIDGMCYGYVIWKSPMSQLAYIIWYFLSFYVVVFIILIFCYWRILIAIRRQARVMAGYGAAGSSTAQAVLDQNQINVVKTMILVSALFAISDLPLQVYALLLGVQTNLTLLEGGYYATMFISFLYICTNPFIYATKFDPVRQILLRLIPCDHATKFDPVKRVLLSLTPCKKTSVQPVESVERATPRIASNRSGQLRI